MDKDYEKKLAVRNTETITNNTQKSSNDTEVKPPGPPDVGDDAWLPS